jgi:hypothetical protein
VGFPADRPALLAAAKKKPGGDPVESSASWSLGGIAAFRSDSGGAAGADSALPLPGRSLRAQPARGVVIQPRTADRFFLVHSLSSARSNWKPSKETSAASLSSGNRRSGCRRRSGSLPGRPTSSWRRSLPLRTLCVFNSISPAMTARGDAVTIRLPAISAVRDFTFPILPPTVSRCVVPFAARRRNAGPAGCHRRSARPRLSAGTVRPACLLKGNENDRPDFCRRTARAAG